MKKSLTLLGIIFACFFASGQDLNTAGFTETMIEGGATYTKMKNGKLDSIIVGMYAVNYGNALLFSRRDEVIFIKNGNDENAVIKIEVKNKKQIKTFLQNNKPLITVEMIDFDLQNLPENATVSISSQNDLITAYHVTSTLASYSGRLDDKSMKLFYRLEIPANLDTPDLIFNYLGDFFIQEDALLKIFYGNYAEKFMPQVVGSFKTDEYGKIKEGIILDFKKKSSKNIYKIYEGGKMIKSASATLKAFEQIFVDYRTQSGEIY